MCSAPNRGSGRGEGVASSAALLLECRRKYKDVLEEARGLKAVVELARGISTHLDLDQLLFEALQAAVALTGAERGYVVLLNEDGEVRVRAQHHLDTEKMDAEELTFSKSVVMHTVETGEPTLSTDAKEDERFAQAASVRLHDLRAVMAAPILNDSGKPMGAVYVDDPLSSGRFNERALKLLQSFADQASVAIQTAQLHDKEMADQKRQHQMAVAKAVQQSLIPKEVPTIGGLEVATCYHAAQDVGGDLYTFPVMADGTQGIFIADVAGKGVPAALVVAKIHEAAKMSAKRTSDPVEFLSFINTSFMEDFKIGNMVTAMLVLLGQDGSSIKMVRAGHLPLCIVRGATRKIEWHEPKGVALGLAPEPVFSSVSEVKEYVLGHGDGILLLTDGVSEAMSMEREEYGFERAEACISKAAGLAAQPFLDFLLADMKKFTGDAAQSDDITVVYVRRSPASS